MTIRRMIAIGGAVGVGKSSAARSLVGVLSADSDIRDVRLIRSDVLRKQMIGIAPETQLPSRYYNDEYYKLVYEVMHRVAEMALSVGDTVVIDATYTRKQQRDALANTVARAASSDEFLGCWLDADLTERTRRLAAREKDASDAGPEYASKQQIEPPDGEPGWHRIRADSLSLDEVVHGIHQLIHEAY